MPEIRSDTPGGCPAPDCILLAGHPACHQTQPWPDHDCLTEECPDGTTDQRA